MYSTASQAAIDEVENFLEPAIDKRYKKFEKDSSIYFNVNPVTEFFVPTMNRETEGRFHISNNNIFFS